MSEIVQIPTLLTEREAAARLGISLSTLQRLRRLGLVSFGHRQLFPELALARANFFDGSLLRFGHVSQICVLDFGPMDRARRFAAHNEAQRQNVPPEPVPRSDAHFAGRHTVGPI